MSDELIKCEVSMGREKSTVVYGSTIEEVFEKLRDFHTMSNVEREYFTRKGNLDSEIASGWYVSSIADSGWVGLTDDEVKEMLGSYLFWGEGSSEHIRFVEAKLKEKNA